MDYATFQPDYLYRLAKSPVAEDRKDLAQAVIGFLHDGLQPVEYGIAEDILMLLLKEAEMDIRIQLADQLAHEPHCPKGLLDFLIYENPFETSKAVLQYSSVLTDADLVEIIQSFEQSDYWQAIARRKEVSQQVTRYLIGTDDKDVYRILIKNRGADFCPISIDWMVQAATRQDDLQLPLIHRPEITPELAAKLYWHVSAELRSQISVRFDLDIKQIDILLNKMVKQRLARRAHYIRYDAETIKQAQKMKQDCAITSHQFLDALQKDNIALFYCLWGALLNCDPYLVQQKMRENGTENLAILCRAARITTRHYNVFLLMWRRYDVTARNGMDLTRALEFYNSMTQDQAKERVISWNTMSAMLQTARMN